MRRIILATAFAALTASALVPARQAGTMTAEQMEPASRWDRTSGFDRNLNTGGNNYDEAKGVVARNNGHHSTPYPSSVTFAVVGGSATSAPAARR